MNIRTSKPGSMAIFHPPSSIPGRRLRSSVPALLAFLGLLVFSSAGWAPAAYPRLFPDLIDRYTVGDTNALNPISNTEGPKTVIAADLNQDGLADVISGNLDGSISVLLGQTNGLSTQFLVPASGGLTNSSIRALVAADFNGDGKLDIAAADIAGKSVIMLLGNGDGTLQFLAKTPVGQSRAIAAADFNQDGKMDLLVACGPPDCDAGNQCCNGLLTNRFLCILRGNGDGAFQEPQYLFSPGVPACFYDVAAKDIDNDGRPDALVLDYSRWQTPTNSNFKHKQLSIFINNGGGNFTTNSPQLTFNAAGEGPRSFTLAYLDEHLDAAGNPPPGATLDIMIANRDSSTLDVFINEGGLDFRAAILIPAGDSPRDIAAGDLNGDGLADVVIVNRNNNTMSILQGLGDGRFSAPLVELPTGVSPRQVVLADFNGDGALDAAVNNRVSEDISLHPGRRGLLGFLVSDAYYPAGITPASIVTEDFNGDHLPDLAVSNLRSHDVRVRFNLGNGIFGPELVLPVNYQPGFLAAGDLNKDGFMDLLVSCLGTSEATTERRGTLVTLLGRGDGTFQNPVSTPLPPEVRQPFWIRIDDLSGDGIPDAAVGGLEGALIVFKGLGTGAFESGLVVGFRGDGRPLGLALGDFDRDGKVDIATSRGLIFMNDGQFFSPDRWGTNANANTWPGRTNRFDSGAQAWAIEAEDLDLDGKLDLMVALTFVRPDPIGVLYGNGDGTFAAPDIYAGPDVGAVALVGKDMDGDGVKDIVVGNRCAATVIIMHGLGNRRFELAEIVSTSPIEDIAVADFNADGKPDLAGVGFGVWALINGDVARMVPPRASVSGGAPERYGLYINEIMAYNVDSFVTPAGVTPDWIEIYNHNSYTQSLGGWSLAQISAEGQIQQWPFPATATIAPWGHLVVYCDKHPALQGYYAPFELSADGETVALYKPGGKEADYVQFPALPADVTYARFFDGARFFELNPAPTPAAANLRPANLSPIIEKRDPYIGGGGATMALTARVFDDVGVAYVGLCYRFAKAGSHFEEIPMSDDGRHGDKLAGDGMFGALLPSLPAGGTVEYYLRVIDLEGQMDNSPDDFNDNSKLHRVPMPSLNNPIRLSELVAANQSGLQDESSQFEDWIELVNTSSQRASLDGLALSRNYFDQSTAWFFPTNCWLNPGERIIVFCDNDGAQGPLHANFKLLRSGDQVYLMRTNADWTILDSLAFGPLPADTSFGIVDGAPDAQLLAWPTPRQPNLPMPSFGAEVLPASGAVRMFSRWVPATANRVSSFTLRWQGAAASTYSVIYSEDLKTWSPALSVPLGLGESLFQWQDSSPSAPRRYYRVIRN